MGTIRITNKFAALSLSSSAPGPASIRAEFKYAGGGMGKGGALCAWRFVIRRKDMKTKYRFTGLLTALAGNGLSQTPRTDYMFRGAFLRRINVTHTPIRTGRAIEAYGFLSDSFIFRRVSWRWKS